jgi:serine/threonine protein kinase
MPAFSSVLLLKERLGDGGFGTVYRAERKMDRRVRSSDLPQLITFAGLRDQSRETVGGHVEPRPSGGRDQLSHPNVVSFIDVVEHKSVKHVVMEYCGRGDLRKFLNFHLELWCVALLLTSRYTPRLQPGC